MSTFIEWVIAVELAVIAVGVWSFPVPATHVLPPRRVGPQAGPREPTKEELDRFLEDMRTTYPPMA